MDIVERLRIVLNSGRLDDDYAGADLLGEAADEIERLRDELQTAIDLRHATLGKYMILGCEHGMLLETLQSIADVSERGTDSLVSQINEMAHKALEGKE